MTRPLVVFIGESNHGDMSYGSLIEKILKDAEEKGLRIWVKNGETWANFYWFGAALFHSEKIHGDMAQDVRNGLEGAPNTTSQHQSSNYYRCKAAHQPSAE